MEQLFNTTNVVNVLTGVGEPTGFTTLNDEHLTTLPQSQSVDDELLLSSFEHPIVNSAIAHNNNFFILIKFKVKKMLVFPSRQSCCNFSLNECSREAIGR